MLRDIIKRSTQESRSVSTVAEGIAGKKKAFRGLSRSPKSVQERERSERLCAGPELSSKKKVEPK